MKQVRQTIRKKNRVLAIAFALLCTAGATFGVNTGWCEFYANSTPTDFGGDYGFACAGTGTGCFDCGEIIDIDG